ncbi:MAG: hypothetical protein QOG45_2614 [Chloroflexota bacterium]|nr:hypothetical protein [Chloroflexota bacterium]
MDPLTLATSAVTLLMSYFGRLGGRAAERAGDDLGDALTSRLEQLYTSIKGRFVNDRLASASLAQLRAQPDDARHQGSLQYALAQILEADPAFGAALSRLVEDARSAGASPRVTISDSGATAVGGGSVTITAHGGSAAGRDATWMQSTGREEG